MKDDSPELAELPAHRNLSRLQAQMLRPASQINMDGSFELGWGMMLICAGLSPYLNAALPQPVWRSPWAAWIAYLPLICMAFAPYAVPRIIKRFITWPRTGYVAHQNDMKLIQLLMLMGFGLALGFSISLAWVLFSEVREFSDYRTEARSIILHGIELAVCVVLMVVLGRKVITKRRLLPTAYDAALINAALRQTAVGRKQARLVHFILVLMFVGIPVLVGGSVLCLVYLSKAVRSHPAIQWPQIGTLSFLVATNAILYLMGNGAALKQHRWKWLALTILLIGPIGVAAAIPYAPGKPEWGPLLEWFPPPVTLFLGLVWVFSGGISLVLFIRRNPLPPAETA